MSGREWTYDMKQRTHSQETEDRHGQLDIPKQFAPLLTWGNLQVQQTENRLDLTLYAINIPLFICTQGR